MKIGQTNIFRDNNLNHYFTNCGYYSYHIIALRFLEKAKVISLRVVCHQGRKNECDCYSKK